MTKQMERSKEKILSAEELFAFADEIGMMIESGISAVEGLTLMLEESETEAEKQLLSDMCDTMYATSSFAKAVEESGVFPEYFCYMLEMGEQTGKTDEVLRALARHYSREHEIAKAIKSAVSYPLLMVTMMLIIIVVLVTQIMPIFERVFIQLGSSMDGISGGILEIGNFMGRYAVVFFLLMGALVAFGIYLLKTKSGRQILLRVCSKNRTFYNIYNKIEASRFASGMAMTISSGMDMTQALQMAGGLVKSEQLTEKITACQEEFQESMDIGTAFATAGIFSGLYGRMAVLAAKTGNLEQVMEKVADTYQSEADEEIHRFIGVVEPTLVIVLSIVVGMILLSVMLPLLNIMAGMN